jgi:hypothetical protein
MSQTLSTPITEYQFLGYDDTHPAELLPKGMFTKADNVFITDNKITKVPGSSSIASSISSYKFNGFTSFEIPSLAVKYLVVNINGASNSQLYKWNGSGSFASIGSANLTNNYQMSFEVANNYLFGLNGVEVVDWDGTTVTKNRGGIPIGYFARWFHNYLFIAKNETYQNRVYWSDIGAPLTFNANNYVDINPGDGDSITALGKIQDELLVFKKNSVWSISGWDGSTFSSTTLAGQNTNARIVGVGCVAPFSVVELGNKVFYFSMNGNSPVIREIHKTVYGVTQAGGIISENIKTTMDTITLSSLNKISSAYDGRYIYWSIPTAGSSVNNKIIALDTWNITASNYPFTTMTGKNAEYFAVSTIPGYATVYFADSTQILSSPITYSGKVFKFDSSIHSDNGANIAIDVRSRKFMLDSSRKSKWKYLYYKYDSGVNNNIETLALIDSALYYTTQDILNMSSISPGLGPTGTFTIGVSTLGGNVVRSHRVKFGGLTGKMLQLQLKESSSSPVGIYEYSIYGYVKGLRDD